MTQMYSIISGNYLAKRVYIVYDWLSQKKYVVIVPFVEIYMYELKTVSSLKRKMFPS